MAVKSLHVLGRLVWRYIIILQAVGRGQNILLVVLRYVEAFILIIVGKVIIPYPVVEHVVLLLVLRDVDHLDRVRELALRILGVHCNEVLLT